MASSNDHYRLNYLKKLIENIPEVKSLISEKQQALQQFDQSAGTAYTPEPHLTPSGDIFVQKGEKITPDPSQRQQIEKEYDQRIEQAVQDNFTENGFEDELEELETTDISTLTEKGVEAEIDRQDQEVDLTLDDATNDQIWQEREDKEPEIDQVPESDLAQDANLILDEEVNEEIWDDRDNQKMDFNDNFEDMGLSPEDDFE